MMTLRVCSSSGVLHTLHVVSGLILYFTDVWSGCCISMLGGYLEHQPRVNFVVQLLVVLEERVDHPKAAGLRTCWTWNITRHNRNVRAGNYVPRHASQHVTWSQKSESTTNLSCHCFTRRGIYSTAVCALSVAHRLPLGLPLQVEDSPPAVLRSPASTPPAAQHPGALTRRSTPLPAPDPPSPLSPTCRTGECGQPSVLPSACSHLRRRLLRLPKLEPTGDTPFRA